MIDITSYKSYNMRVGTYILLYLAAGNTVQVI